MARRIVLLVALCVLASMLASPVLARSHIIAQKSSKVPLGTVYLSHGLRPGHTYRIEVTASGHQPFVGSGTEQIVGVYQHRLFTSSPNLRLNGTTPRSFVVTQPIRGKLSEWILAVEIQLKRGRGLTVRFVDLG